MSNNDIPKELHCPACVPFDGGFKCNELECNGLQFKTPYTSETLKSFDALVKSGSAITQEIINILAFQLNVKVIQRCGDEYIIKDCETDEKLYTVNSVSRLWRVLQALYQADVTPELWFDSNQASYECPYEASEAEYAHQMTDGDYDFTHYLELLRITCEKYNQYNLRGLQGRMGLAEAYLYGWGVLIDQPKALQMFRNLSIQALNLIQIRED